MDNGLTGDGVQFQRRKSTTLAAGLASKGKRVLLVDGCSQANATRFLQLKPADGLARLLAGEPLKPLLMGNFGVLLLSGGKKTANIQANPLALRKRLKELDGYMDYVVIDSSPTISELHVSFFFASDYVLIPTQLEFLSIQGVLDSIDHLENARAYGQEHQIPTAAVLAIAPNMVKKEVVQDQNLEYLIERFGPDNVLSPIRQRTAWRQAAQLSTPIFTFDARSMAAREAERFVREVEERLQ